MAMGYRNYYASFQSKGLEQVKKRQFLWWFVNDIDGVKKVVFSLDSCNTKTKVKKEQTRRENCVCRLYGFRCLVFRNDYPLSLNISYEVWCSLRHRQELEPTIKSRFEKKPSCIYTFCLFIVEQYEGQRQAISTIELSHSWQLVEFFAYYNTHTMYVLRAVMFGLSANLFSQVVTFHLVLLLYLFWSMYFGMQLRSNIRISFIFHESQVEQGEQNDCASDKCVTSLGAYK